MPAPVSAVENGQRATRDVALFWKDRRVLIEVVKHDVMLDFAWKDLLRVCLQIDPVPQYVVLTNQRDLHLYDLGRDREAPRLSIPLDDLPKYSEAFPFLAVSWAPGTLPKIINVSKVSREVAELVALHSERGRPNELRHLQDRGREARDHYLHGREGCAVRNFGGPVSVYELPPGVLDPNRCDRVLVTLIAAGATRELTHPAGTVLNVLDDRGNASVRLLRLPSTVATCTLTVPAP